MFGNLFYQASNDIKYSEYLSLYRIFINLIKDIFTVDVSSMTSQYILNNRNIIHSNFKRHIFDKEKILQHEFLNSEEGLELKKKLEALNV